MDRLRILFDIINCFAKVDIFVDHKDASLTPEFNALNFVFFKGQLAATKFISSTSLRIFLCTQKTNE